MSEFADFTSDQYNKLFDAYLTKFPEDNNLKQSVSFFALLLAQFVADTMQNNAHLDKDYHSALMEMVTRTSQMYIDSARLQTDKIAVDWEKGKHLLKED